LRLGEEEYTRPTYRWDRMESELKRGDDAEV
jgi:hypothetical protein